MVYNLEQICQILTGVDTHISNTKRSLILDPPYQPSLVVTVKLRCHNCSYIII